MNKYPNIHTCKTEATHLDVSYLYSVLDVDMDELEKVD